jgi:hypothetical protein
MNRPAQIRAIFAELRSALGETHSDRELLRLAHSIILAYTAAGKVDDDIADTLQSNSFFSSPIDEAMQDGGWQVLDFESKRGTVFEDGMMTEFEDNFAPEYRSLISRLNQIRRQS